MKTAKERKQPWFAGSRVAPVSSQAAYPVDATRVVYSDLMDSARRYIDSIASNFNFNQTRQSIRQVLYSFMVNHYNNIIIVNVE